MKKQFLISLTTTLLFFGFVFQGCNDVEEPPIENEEELITSVELIFTIKGGGSETFKFADPDGEGGNAPTQFDTIKLLADTVYDLEVRFLDESKSPAENITEEVEEESDEHLVCYTSDISTITINDTDGNGLPLGLSASVSTMAASDGVFDISLKHQPDVKDGTCSLGETDVEVAFPLLVK